jgi:hypothetical protein
LTFVTGGGVATAAGFGLQDMMPLLSHVASRSVASTVTAVESRG